jgi:hypothetical protein
VELRPNCESEECGKVSGEKVLSAGDQFPIVDFTELRKACLGQPFLALVYNMERTCAFVHKVDEFKRQLLRLFNNFLVHIKKDIYFVSA